MSEILRVLDPPVVPSFEASRGPKNEVLSLAPVFFWNHIY